jgi:hypothetical protein
MADFIITAPDGQKYKVSGENQQGAYAALQESFGGSAPQEQPSGFLENAADIAGAGIAGAGRTAMEILGLPATIGKYMDIGAKKIGLLREDAPESALFNALSGSNIRDVASDVTGGATEYRGVSTPAKYAGTVGEMLVGAPLKVGVLAGLGSETLGQATEGTAAEPFARIGGALLAPLAASKVVGLARGAVTPNAGVSPQRIKQAGLLEQYGVPVTAGQKVNKDALVRSEMMSPTGANIIASQDQAFTSAALKMIGVDAAEATPEILMQANKSIVGKINGAFEGVSFQPIKSLADDISQVVKGYTSKVTLANKSPFLRQMSDDISNAVKQGRTLDTATLRSYRSDLSELTTSPIRETKDAAIKLLNIVDKQIENALKAAGRDADIALLKEGRGQYRNYLAIEKALGTARGAEGIIAPSALSNALKGQGLRAYTNQTREIGKLARAGQAVLKKPKTSGTSENLSANLVPQLIRGTVGGSVGSVFGPLGSAAGAAAGIAAPRVASEIKMMPFMQQYLANQKLGAYSPISTAGQLPRLTGGLLAQQPQ